MAGSTSKTVIIALVAVGGVMLASCGCCFLTFFGILGAARSSPAYQQSFAEVSADPDVMNKLGSPITEGMSTNFKFDSSNGVTKHELSYSINGPKGSANVTANSLDAGKGTIYEVHKVEFGDGTVIDLLNKAKDEPAQPTTEEMPSETESPPVAPPETEDSAETPAEETSAP